MEELKELLPLKSSSEMLGIDLRAMKNPKSPLDSFEVSPATTQERASGNTDEQKVTIGLGELRRLLASEAPEVNAIGTAHGPGRRYPQQPPYQQSQEAQSYPPLRYNPGRAFGS